MRIHIVAFKYFLPFLFLQNVGCASLSNTWKSMIGSNDDNKKVVSQDELANLEPAPTRFSENPFVMNDSQRHYKRMTRERLEQESEIQSSAGSTWVMEGQGAYLFTQNKSRREGDLLNVKLEGASLRQVETKVAVIKKLLAQLDAANNPPPTLNTNLAQTANNGENRAPATASENKASTPDGKSEDKQDLSEIQTIPARIVERLPDGNYRVKGSHPFMIGKREYKVLVMGIVRPEDYNDEGMNASKLLDPQFDVVSLRRSTQ